MQRHFLCHQQDVLEAQPREFELTTEQASLSLFLVRYENKLYAYQNRCPHLDTLIYIALARRSIFIFSNKPKLAQQSINIFTILARRSKNII